MEAILTACSGSAGSIFREDSIISIASTGSGSSSRSSLLYDSDSDEIYYTKIRFVVSPPSPGRKLSPLTLNSMPPLSISTSCSKRRKSQRDWQSLEAVENTTTLPKFTCLQVLTQSVSHSDQQNGNTIPPTSAAEGKMNVNSQHLMVPPIDSRPGSPYPSAKRRFSLSQYANQPLHFPRSPRRHFHSPHRVDSNSFLMPSTLLEELRTPPMGPVENITLPQDSSSNAILYACKQHHSPQGTEPTSKSRGSLLSIDLEPISLTLSPTASASTAQEESATHPSAIADNLTPRSSRRLTPLHHSKQQPTQGGEPTSKGWEPMLSVSPTSIPPTASTTIDDPPTPSVVPSETLTPNTLKGPKRTTSRLQRLFSPLHSDTVWGSQQQHLTQGVEEELSVMDIPVGRFKLPPLDLQAANNQPFVV
jgi:hypothetical protein